MAQKKYSTGLSKFDAEISNNDLTASLKGLTRFLGRRTLKTLIWDETHIAIPLSIQVELPPLGNFESIDIRQVEPVIFVINTKSYPWVPPKVYSDRLDFPKNRLAHLYVAKKGKPPAFCLVRGTLSEWYSNKQLKDLFIRTKNWLRDASTGELVMDGNQFDPVRLEGYSGIVIYDYDKLAKIVNEEKSFMLNENCAVGFFERKVVEKGISFKLNKIITTENLMDSSKDVIQEIKKDNLDTSKKYYHYGYVIWSKEATSFSDYSVDLPNDWVSFKVFCTQYAIDFSSLERHIAEYNINSYVSIPVIIGIKRPKKLIGFSDKIEFFNFYLVVDSTDIKDHKIINNIPVCFQIHNQPLSVMKAKEISGFHADLGIHSLVIGCGALGSKIIMHLARSGSTNFLLVDPDELSPHNLVRHTAFASGEGVNKAVLLEKEIKAIYPYEQIQLEAINVPGEVFLTAQYTKLCNWIFDFTASNTFFQSVVKANISESTRICRAFISDFGNLGILFFEGENRNPRVDDLQVMMYASYKSKSFISDWLKREQEGIENNISVSVGVGCNSETIVLSDDTISLHAAFFSGIIKSESHKSASTNGKIYLNEIKREPFFSNSTKLLEIPSMVVFQAINDPSWQIRIPPTVMETMKKEMGLSMPSETGGVLIGCANYKTKTIHVSDLIPAPHDSQANPACFFRGVKGLPQAIEDVNKQTGSQLGYIGEWHTHPFGPNMLSSVDFDAIKKFKADFDSLPTPLPVFLMIVTPTHILPYVY